MDNFDINIVNQTDVNLSEYETFINNLICYSLNYLKVIEDVELAIILVDNKEIRKINQEYRNIDDITDVISFALEDKPDLVIENMPRSLGDIFISIEKTRSQANEYGHTFEREFAFLVVHGLLHLLGYDHKDEVQEKIMFDLQEAILNDAGIKRGN